MVTHRERHDLLAISQSHSLDPLQLSLAMRGRLPTGRDALRTALGILRSTAFLTTNAFTFCMFLCIIRRYVGHFNHYTFAFVPSLVGSLCAILIERPSRRGMLALYVSNVASEALFQMAVERGALRPWRGGAVAVFAAGAAALMYVFRQTEATATAATQRPTKRTTTTARRRSGGAVDDVATAAVPQKG